MLFKFSQHFNAGFRLECYSRLISLTELANMHAVLNLDTYLPLSPVRRIMTAFLKPRMMDKNNSLSMV